VGAGGMLGVWDDEVLRGSIPDTWDSISGMYRKMNDELEDEARNAKDLGGEIKFPDIDLGAGIKKTQEEIERALKELSTITLSEFVLDPSVANDIDNCFIMANQCLNTKFTSLADLVAGGVEYIQAGVGGNIFNLSAINDLVTQAQGMGGAIATEATRIAQQVALMTQQMADPSLEQTVNPKAIAAEIKQLNATVDARILSTANSIAAATANVNGLVDQWAHMANDWMDPSLGYGEQFGVLGSAFGEATGRANDMYNRIRGFRFKRRKQVRGGGGGAVQIDYGEPDDVASGIHLPMDSGGTGAGEVDKEYTAEEVVEAVASGALIPEGGLSAARGVDTSISVVHPTDFGGSDFYDYSDEGMQFGGAGGRGGRRGVQNMSHSVMNISINTKSSVQDILSDLKRIQYMDDASFFNSVS